MTIPLDRPPAAEAEPELLVLQKWETIVSFEHLCSAARAAERSKRAVRGVARFGEQLEPAALQMQRELLDGSSRPGAPGTFVVHDPKSRGITTGGPESWGRSPGDDLHALETNRRELGMGFELQ